MTQFDFGCHIDDVMAGKIKYRKRNYHYRLSRGNSRSFIKAKKVCLFCFCFDKQVKFHGIEGNPILSICIQQQFSNYGSQNIMKWSPNVKKDNSVYNSANKPKLGF